MAIHKLTPRFAQTTKTKGMYADGGGLYLQVGSGGGAKSWIFRYHVEGRGDRQMGLGPFHTIGLAEARKLARQCREMRLDGIDPLEARKAKRLALKLAEAKNMTFADCAQECLDQRANDWVPSTTRGARRLVRTYLLPALGSLPVNVVERPQVHNVLKPLYETKPATAVKVQDYLAAILNWAMAKDYRPTGVNPAARSGPISTLLPKVGNRKIKHHASLAYQEIGAFMAGLRNFRPKNRQGIEETEESLNALLLQFIILTAVRTSQAREARWEEFNLNTKVWTCPPERTKFGKVSKTAHVIYLSAPALQVLKTMQVRQAADRTAGEYVFTYGQQDAPRMGQQMVGQPIMGDTHLIKFLQNTLGRKDLTVHGFRSSFKSWQVDHYPLFEIAGEMALDHAVGTEVRRIYARDAKMIKQRRQLMDAWAEYCGRPEPLDAKGYPDADSPANGQVRRTSRCQ